MPVFVWDYNMARPWSLLLGTYAETAGPPVTAGVCVIHWNGASAEDVSLAWLSAPDSCIGIAVRGPGYPSEAQTHNRSNLYFRRSGVSAAGDDPSFRSCFARFLRAFRESGRPNFNFLEPDGIPEALLAWVLTEKVRQPGASIATPAAVDSAHARIAFNSLRRSVVAQLPATVSHSPDGPSDAPDIPPEVADEMRLDDAVALIRLARLSR